MKTFATMTAVTALTAGAAFAETWDMPLAYPATNFHTETAQGFADCVRDATSGEIDIQTHPNGSLFPGGDIKRAVQTGQALIGERLLSAHANENALFGYDSIPFLATSFDDSVKLNEAAQPALEELLASQNLHYLYSVPWPPQGLYAKKEINSAADLEGVKFRAYNAATARLAELAKMQPVQIEAAELSQALATGVAESFVSSGSTGYDEKVWEHLTHFYQVDAWLPRNTIFVNLDAWNGLSEENKTAMSDCAATAAETGLAKSKELTQFYLDGLAEGGMTVAPPGDQLRTDFMGFGETMTTEWLEATGEQGQSIVDGFKN
ncbi:C4-dicarboxylate ABC transporter substrate-binding protein [Silicimonas algicola]|uniref:TRAP-type C4-dicarboxylate transport system substrate-binding protein n=1 Tax=Silicimonas algicola TaxID=1826607 RepID=A0A316GKU2_9RHOB|nr:TRAP transporter substrate-binding protein [Silicimonas algicola]AZQ67041.1 C4-dicarboxylate ABC transporter substrate-binding protein [Silicimonas algicola]PWK55437.1 TRAP-type C4-dicarboxylate transport system substrate-binding protein [Silicimonas algicola]